MLRRTSTSPPAYIPVKTILSVLFLLVLLVVALAIAKKLGLLTATISSKWPFYVKYLLPNQSKSSITAWLARYPNTSSWRKFKFPACSESERDRSPASGTTESIG